VSTELEFILSQEQDDIFKELFSNDIVVMNSEKRIIFEIGCGVGNSLFLLLEDLGDWSIIFYMDVIFQRLPLILLNQTIDTIVNDVMYLCLIFPIRTSLLDCLNRYHPILWFKRNLKRFNYNTRIHIYFCISFLL